MTRRVAVVGCGYLGIELGTRLADAGAEVVGVRRSDGGLESVRDAGLGAVRADATDAGTLGRIPDADAVVYAASAGGRDADAAREAYVEGLSTTVEHFAGRADPPDRLVYTSSTGVYGDRGGAWVDESTPPDPGSERGRVLLEAERIAIEDASERGIDGTVARLAGLYGPGRYRLERYLDGPVAEGWLNLVHRDDAAGAVAFLLERDLARGEVVLVVDDEPAWRPDLAAWLAGECGVEPPTTEPADGGRAGADKRCSNGKLRGLGYGFEYPTYREGYREAVEGYRP